MQIGVQVFDWPGFSTTTKQRTALSSWSYINTITCDLVDFAYRNDPTFRDYSRVNSLAQWAAQNGKRIHFNTGYGPYSSGVPAGWSAIYPSGWGHADGVSAYPSDGRYRRWPSGADAAIAAGKNDALSAAFAVYVSNGGVAKNFSFRLGNEEDYNAVVDANYIRQMNYWHDNFIKPNSDCLVFSNAQGGIYATSNWVSELAAFKALADAKYNNLSDSRLDGIALNIYQAFYTRRVFGGSHNIATSAYDWTAQCVDYIRSKTRWKNKLILITELGFRLSQMTAISTEENHWQRIETLLLYIEMLRRLGVYGAYIYCLSEGTSGNLNAIGLMDTSENIFNGGQMLNKKSGLASTDPVVGTAYISSAYEGAAPVLPS